MCTCVYSVCVETVANIGMKIMVLLPVVVGDIEIMFQSDNKNNMISTIFL